MQLTETHNTALGPLGPRRITKQNGRMPHIAETFLVSAIFVIPLSGRIVNIVRLSRVQFVNKIREAETPLNHHYYDSDFKQGRTLTRAYHKVTEDRKVVNLDEKDSTEVKQEQSQQPLSAVKPEPTSNTVVVQPINTEQGHKPSMVAEPPMMYNVLLDNNRRNWVVRR